jgi:hypothetical protein
MGIRKIKIFLASSNELALEREQFEREVYRKCKMWIDNEIFLHLDIWEDISAKMSKTRSQDEYNKYISECDLFVLLAHTKVGIYSAEEFEEAFGKFKSTDKPFIFTYFKKSNKVVEPTLNLFKSKLQSLEHFYSSFTDSDNLWNQFNKELDRLKADEFTTNDWEKKESKKGYAVNNEGANIKNQFIGGSFDNTTFN